MVAAVANGDVGQVAALLANGANPDETDNLDAWASALTIAVMAKNVEAVVLLVKAGANPHGPNDDEDPVFVAAGGGGIIVLGAACLLLSLLVSAWVCQVRSDPARSLRNLTRVR